MESIGSPASGQADVVVVTGIGGMGIAAARRLAPGRRLVLADVAGPALTQAALLLRGEGHDVHEIRADISDPDAVRFLAVQAASLGRLATVVHTAGVSPTQASVERIVEVDVLGTAHVLDAFLEHAVTGTVVVCIASMGAAFMPLPADAELTLATAPAAELAKLGVLDTLGTEPGVAYAAAKRANQVRVQAASIAYGRRGARVVSVSPGVISTPMGRAELDGPSGDRMRAMVAASGTGRVGTPDDIAAAVEFLAGPAAAFITGTDLLVDGGVVAAARYGHRG